MLVSTTFLRSQKNLTFNLTSGPTDFLCCFASKLVSRCWSNVAHFYTRKGTKRRRISHPMVSRLSHDVEVQFKRWNHCKVQVLNNHLFQAPSWLILGPRSHSERFRNYTTWPTCSTEQFHTKFKIVWNSFVDFCPYNKYRFIWKNVKQTLRAVFNTAQG